MDTKIQECNRSARISVNNQEQRVRLLKLLIHSLPLVGKSCVKAVLDVLHAKLYLTDITERDIDAAHPPPLADQSVMASVAAPEHILTMANPGMDDSRQIRICFQKQRGSSVIVQFARHKVRQYRLGQAQTS